MTSIPTALIRLPSPIGRLELTGDDEGVCSLSIEAGGHLPREESPENPSPVLVEAARQLTEYFAGSRSRFSVPLHPSRGTAFQREVWARLADQDFGTVTTYGELGLSIDRPGSGRAIGGAVGANPLPILIGCHRVLASDGRITGYSGGSGIPTKEWLLDHEGIEYRA
jgi:methylated-DNA-[protein]-cysteine S-methyltransferase